MIQIRDLEKSYLLGDKTVGVLHGISLAVRRGEFIAIMGPSGSGKSTLLNIIGCLDEPDGGSYRMDGVELAGASESALAGIRNRRLGFVFQLFNLVPRISAIRNVELPLLYAGLSAERRREKAGKMLEMVGLVDRAEHSPARLSGGQQQRVAIARALVNDPDIIIADEPTGSLDSLSSADIMQLFSQLNRRGITVVMVTHDEEIAAFAGRIIRLRDGRLDGGLV
ncbi:ABC transporter ATP-binding protein [Herbaspirillum sp. AP02]|uniref:ABC transporter ATP-binding protein n=1 Tax=unclassified Herbaspirillum TaxID=2624150 RepID=UPI0015D97B4F|nr:MULTISPECIES: ABC transporter ATP-binding protein [unclassified Herbaspirillum]MBG7620563.1 ABC transporter ATP-binding protein [Herbaspirillum sp. AP02]NZD68027.1 ABC transporter ATP-binding protein [Herbaspirillum sp. AP21]